MLYCVISSPQLVFFQKSHALTVLTVFNGELHWKMTGLLEKNLTSYVLHELSLRPAAGRSNNKQIKLKENLLLFFRFTTSRLRCGWTMWSGSCTLLSPSTFRPCAAVRASWGWASRTSRPFSPPAPRGVPRGPGRGRGHHPPRSPSTSSAPCSAGSRQSE